MQTLHDVHQQFASFFKSKTIQAFAYLVSKNLSEGHICLPLNDFENLRSQLPPYYQQDFDIYKLSKEALLSHQVDERKPFVLYQNNLYLHRYFFYESNILNKIKTLIKNENKTLFFESIGTLKSEIENLFDLNHNLSEESINWQCVASLMALSQNFSIITGGPGTGKTTTVAKILYLLYLQNPNLKVALTAPTGKAATRMAESLKNAAQNFSAESEAWFQQLQPSTIHRLLKFNASKGNFTYHEQQPLPYDVIIVDESSMIDVALFSQLIMAVNNQSKIIFLGDQNQLASVEAGSLFGDLCLANPLENTFSIQTKKHIKSNFPSLSHLPTNTFQQNTPILFEHSTALKVSYRFNDDEGIGKFSKAIIQADEEAIHQFLNEDNQAQVKIISEIDSRIFEKYVLAYADYIHESDIAMALKKLNRFKILCAVREGELGLYSINRKVEKILTSHNLIHITDEFYENRPLIVTQNNYALGLFNGDIGLVRADENGIVKVWFENEKGEIEGFLPALLNKIETVFALTVHKSQGSEFEQVYIVLPQQENAAILSKELLYTAVTRAKKSVILQASIEVILKAVRTKVKRTSGITQRLLLETEY